MSAGQTTIACRACGHTNPHESSFCRMCGVALDVPTERLPDADPASALPQAASPQTARARRSRVVGALVAAGAVLAAGTGAAAVLFLASSGSSHKHTHNVSAGVIDRVTQKVTTPEGTAAATPSQSQSAVQPGGWPAGVDGYTVALASDKIEADARQAFQQAIARGLTSVGLVRSGEYRSLRPGYWFVFSGVYHSAGEAAEHVAAATAAGFAGAYPRRMAR